ncbi:hypothetical protein ACFSO0_17940 [Brevibacillus sp. GCM10020057]|uniref:hypothetical protein n=1 Tax=Brevibacillus sp. GCM10020057 TaxID=3317327 RepID=UPI00362A33DF
MKAKIAEQQAAAMETAKKAAEKDKMLKEHKLYNEQDFIRFYYSYYAPLLKLRQAHFDEMAKWPAMDKAEQSDSLKKLTNLANQTLKALDEEVPLPTSPLLVQAHGNFTNSVRAYLDSMEQVRSDQNSNALTPAAIASRMTLFQNSWLLGQELFYHSAAIWESAYVVNSPFPKALPENVSTSQWKQFPFHYRNYVSASLMSAGKEWKSYSPEDLTARIDKLLTSQEAQSIGVKDIQAAVRLLEATDAIHPGDFLQLSGKLYSRLQAPEIPLYK